MVLFENEGRNRFEFIADLALVHNCLLDKPVRERGVCVKCTFNIGMSEQHLVPGNFQERAVREANIIAIVGDRNT